MKLYKNSDLDFTLVTHDHRMYKLCRQGQVTLSSYIGKIKPNSPVNGVLLKNIPNFLKNKCFTLNSKSYGKPK